MIRRTFKYILTLLIVSLFFVIYLVKNVDDVFLNSYNKLGFADSFISELVLLNSLAVSLGFYLYILDAQLLSSFEETKFAFPARSSDLKNVTLAVEHRHIARIGIDNILSSMQNSNCESVVFKSNELPKPMNDSVASDPVAFILKHTFIYIIYVLYPREENTWWLGKVADDDQCELKFKNLFLPEQCSGKNLPNVLVNRFHFSENKVINNDLPRILIPNNNVKFIEDYKHSKFIECNSTRALLFKKKYGKVMNSQAVRFRHRAWKILSKAKAILDILNIPFWLSSGTCLGFFRECDIIAHSKDVDIGVFAKYFNESIIHHMESHGLKLKHRFGFPNDSLELSFIDHGGVKLDVFFFYMEDNYFWNGGTQLKTRKKFKYIFPVFDLCWTFFCGLKVRVPCQTEEYITANYGSNWFTPVTNWDWKTSPNNVYPNGYWPHGT